MLVCDVSGKKKPSRASHPIAIRIKQAPRSTAILDRMSFNILLQASFPSKSSFVGRASNRSDGLDVDDLSRGLWNWVHVGQILSPATKR
jgi:hypothetical protein